MPKSNKKKTAAVKGITGRRIDRRALYDYGSCYWLLQAAEWPGFDDSDRNSEVV